MPVGQALPGIKHLIAVASGKGGVGKSTVAVNLALAFAAEGRHAGILDADIYGPSQPRMLGVREQKPKLLENRKMTPVAAHGLKSMSIGYLIDEETPMIWRGPMVTQALHQMLHDVEWGELDVLVVDLPPGTGDIHLSLVQRIPLAGAVIVTTPQDIALLDARKGLKMFLKVNVPVLGVVENMSTHVCAKCGHEEAIFGAGGGEALAKEEGVELLGQIPLDLRIREQADSGCPTVAAEPDSPISSRYREIARNIITQLERPGSSPSFPKISIVED
jgi:ATP-binding protein involved in chromosome partitioning